MTCGESSPFLSDDATELRQQIRQGEITITELLEASINQITATNPLINAVIHPLFEKARQQVATAKVGDGPFHGIPIVVKDLLCATAGDPYHLGMRALRERSWTASQDSYLAKRFRDAGFIIVGRSNTPELGASASTEPFAYGPTRNPWNSEYSAGGSSGGSAAAVASGMVSIAHGNDMGGSIRIPASACGLLGLKPSRGRISLGPEHVEYWGPLAQDSILTRSARDLGNALDAIGGSMPGDLYQAPIARQLTEKQQAAPLGRLRFNLLPEEWDSEFDVDRECRKAVEVAGLRFQELGHDVSWGAPPGLGPGREPKGPLIGAYICKELDDWSRKIDHQIGPDDVEPWTWQLAELGRRMSATQYLSSLEERLQHARELNEWWEEGPDILVTPTMPCLPPKLGVDPTLLNSVCGRFTIPWNFSGQPAISLPIHVSAGGLPVGVQLIAGYGKDDLLVRLASQLEEMQPWPTLHTRQAGTA